MKTKPYLILLFIASTPFWGCEKAVDGKNSLMRQVPEPPGANCAAGGYKVITGIDENRNNELDSNEIQQTNYVCNGNYNKETILSFTDNGIWSTSVNGVIPSHVVIENFNITNYLVDSASFGGKLVTADANVKAIVELYDLTNNKVIDHTLLMSNSLTYEFKTTPLNFIGNIPKSPIKLGLRVRTEKEGTMVTIHSPELRLYRK